VSVIFHTLRPYDVVSNLMTSHPWQIDQHRSTTNSVGLDYEQCGARTWAWFSGAHSHSPKKDCVQATDMLWSL